VNDPRIFPAALIALNLCAAIAYGLSSDIRRAVYWLAAAILTATVTF
jgi:hypothetical protein